MPALARGEGQDTINCGHGCESTTVTEECSSDVKVNGFGVVRQGDKCKSHTYPVGILCVPHAPAVDTDYSSTVFVNGKPAALVGTKHNQNGPHTIVTGSPDVNIG